MLQAGFTASHLASWKRYERLENATKVPRPLRNVVSEGRTKQYQKDCNICAMKAVVLMCLLALLLCATALEWQDCSPEGQTKTCLSVNFGAADADHPSRNYDAIEAESGAFFAPVKTLLHLVYYVGIVDPLHPAHCAVQVATYWQLNGPIGSPALLADAMKELIYGQQPKSVLQMKRLSSVRWPCIWIHVN